MLKLTGIRNIVFVFLMQMNLLMRTDGEFDEEIAYYERFHADCGLVYGELNQIP